MLILRVRHKTVVPNNSICDLLVLTLRDILSLKPKENRA